MFWHDVVRPPFMSGINALRQANFLSGRCYNVTNERVYFNMTQISRGNSLTLSPLMMVLLPAAASTDKYIWSELKRLWFAAIRVWVRTLYDPACWSPVVFHVMLHHADVSRCLISLLCFTLLGQSKFLQGAKQFHAEQITPLFASFCVER